MIKSQKYLKSIAKGVLVLMMVISLGWGAMAVPVSAADVSISQLIELFISLGIIAPEKAAAARSAAGVSSPAVTLITPNTIQDIDFQVMKQPSQTVKVSRCQNISKPGNYILTGNIKNDSGKPCITISDVKNVTFDCKGKTIQSTAENFAILVKNSSDFIVQNCSVLSSVNVTSINPAQHMFRLENSSKGNVNNNTIGGTYSTISSSTEIEFKSNTVSATTFQIFQSNFVNIISNKFSAAIVNTGAVVQFKEGINNKFIGNSVDGKSDGIRHGNSAPPNIGPDDVVVLDNQNSINVSNNNIRNSWECGIESVGFLNDSTIANNKIDNVALAGICGWHWLNFSENTISNNTITNSPSLFVYFRDYDLRPGESQMKFINNYFDSNKLITQRMDGLREQGYSSSIRVYAPPGKGGGFEFSNFTDEQVVTGNNVFKNNDFGLFLKAPILFPASMFVDGGGNICSSSSEINYPIKCETDKFLKPVIN
ncbi:MAG: right-handed parallel beta-helix repeat-containing protein, partial [bacterium]